MKSILIAYLFHRNPSRHNMICNQISDKDITVSAEGCSIYTDSIHHINNSWPVHNLLVGLQRIYSHTSVEFNIQWLWENTNTHGIVY